MTDFALQSPKATPSKKPSPRSLLPLLPYLLRYKGQLISAFIALTMAAGTTLVVPLAIRRMIDFGFSQQSPGLIRTYFIGLIAVVALLALASGARFYFVTMLGERVVADLRAQVFKHLCRLDASFYDTAQTGELMSRLTADTTQMKSAFGASASVALRNLFLFLGAISLMVYSSPKLSAYVLIAIPFIVLPLVASGRGVRKRSRVAQDRLAEASAYAAESLTAVRTMQAYTAVPWTAQRFAEAVEASFRAAGEATAARAILTVVVIFLVFTSVVGVLWFGAQDVLAGRMTGGLLSQFLLYAILGGSALGELSQVSTELTAAAGAAERIGEILKVEPQIVAPKPALALPKPGRGEIVFENVEFAYPTRPDMKALDGLSFKIEPGETIAIVGPSGAGKSTLFQLLMRFYDPLAGKILFDGVDIKMTEPADLRAHIRSVPQDPVIFSASITDNIRYGAPEASDSEVREAAIKAAADEFIQALPEGYSTRAGERGITLSGGQRQRIAIARAILSHAPVLLLDEATSALDAENEVLVQSALDKLIAGRTTIVIAHRLATVLKADRILVLEDGRVIEEGTHKTLVAREGLYARLAKLQFETGAAALQEHKATLAPKQVAKSF
jgi:ATP-binding cassette subfamily B protein